MKNINFGTLFLILLLVGIFSFAMAADKIQCIHCGSWDIPGQHDCPDVQKATKKAEEAKKKAEEATKEAD